MRRPVACTIFGLLLVVASLGVLAGTNAPAASAAVGDTATPAQLAAVGAPPCPVGWACQAMPCHGGSNCGFVEAGPTANLGPDQWVYLNFYGLPALETVDLHYCQNTGSLTAPPLCAYQDTVTEPQASLEIESLPNGTASTSFQVVQVSGKGCVGIPAVVTSGVPVQCDPNDELTWSQSQIFCDSSGSNNCSIDLTVPYASSPSNATPNVQNTLAVPVSFSANNGACGTAKQVLSESEFGFQQIFQASDQVTCQKSGAAIPFNTEIDGLGALQALDGGSIQMAFTDDPQAPDQQAIIKKDKLLLIPIAYSANVIGDHAEMNLQSSIYYQTGIKLTAALAAGIVSGITYSPQSDEPASCTQGSSKYACGVMGTLNSVPGFKGAQAYLSYLRSDAAGSTEQMLAWICSSTKASVSIASLNQTLTETQSAEQVLLDGLFPGGGAPKSGCLASDQLPAFISQTGTATAFSTPGQQDLKMTNPLQSGSVLPPGSATFPESGFAPMNWAESSYYGLDSALLQNAAGQFVAPSLASVDAGIADGSWSNGQWTPNYANTNDAAAYAMPTVMYAVVPTAADITAADKAGIQSSLNSILAVTGATSLSSSLPLGILPLSKDVAVTSSDEVANGVGNPNYVVPAIGQTSPASASGRSANSFSSSSTFALGSLSPSAAAALAKAAGGAASDVIPSSSPTYGPITLTATEGRLLLPATISLGALMALIGIAMMSSSGLSQRRMRRKASLEADAETASVGEDL